MTPVSVVDLHVTVLDSLDLLTSTWVWESKTRGSACTRVGGVGGVGIKR